MSEAALAREFLDIVAGLETALRGLGETDARGLGELVRDFQGRNSLVGRYQKELRAFAELRNAIVHNAYKDDRPIATPLPETVQTAARVLAQLNNPAKALATSHKPVTFDENDPLQHCLRQMRDLDLSQAPVTAGGSYRCMLTTNAVARWLAANVDEHGDILLTNVRVADVIEHREQHEAAVFVGRTISAAAAVDRLTHERPPLALLITQSGREGEAILGLLVGADVPALLRALAI